MKVPIGLKKTIRHMLKTGEVDVTMLSQEDKIWLGRMCNKYGGFSLEKPLLLKQKRGLKLVKSTNPAYFILELLPDK